MPYPLGSYPFGYHLIDFGERYTNMGAEATMIFIGPSTDRFSFLKQWFPAWWINADPVEGPCCVTYVAGTGPSPYPDIDRRGSFGAPPIPVCNTLIGAELWPDTYSIAPYDATCTPYPLECYDGIGAPVPIIQHPVYYGGTDSGDECFAEITINFRRKVHAGWPRSMYPCDFATVTPGEAESDNWVLPPVTHGTYIEVTRNPSTEMRPLDSSGVEYKVDELYEKNDIADVCDTEVIGAATIPAFCDPPPTPLADLEDDEKATHEQLVFSENLEVRWTSVPMANWQALRRLLGRVNESVWLGYPPEAVRFARYQVDEVSDFGGVDLYNITFNFDIAMAPVENADDNSYTLEYLERGIYKGFVGIWNRVWSPTPMRTNTFGSASTVCLNWIPYRAIRDITDCCPAAIGNVKIYPPGCFSNLFTVPLCPTPP